MKRLILIAVAALALTGCDNSTRVPREQRAAMSVDVNSRVNVTKISEFRDDLAYDDIRGVYLITDKETGQEFIGVSGIGISAIGQHNCGKSCYAKDER